MRHNPRLCGLRRGFTLIELVIVVAVIGVLALIAYPGFQDSVRKSRRADAMAGLMRLQQLQERYRGNAPAYASAVASMAAMGATDSSPERHYTLSIDGTCTSAHVAGRLAIVSVRPVETSTLRAESSSSLETTLGPQNFDVMLRLLTRASSIESTQSVPPTAHVRLTLPSVK